MTTTPQAALLSDDEIERHFENNKSVPGRELRRLIGRSIEAAILAKLQATQAEPVQAGELPPLPHDGWPARFRCDSCGGNGEIGEPMSMGHFQPPERQRCPDCDGRGWIDEGPAFNADHMRDYARAALAARKPMTDEQIDALRIKSTNAMQALADRGLIPAPEVCDEDLVRRVERAHGIGLEVKP